MYLLLDMTNKARLYGMNDPITKKITLSRDVIFDKWLVGYYHVLDKQKDDEGPFPLGLSVWENKTTEAKQENIMKEFQHEILEPPCSLEPTNLVCNPPTQLNPRSPWRPLLVDAQVGHASQR